MKKLLLAFVVSIFFLNAAFAKKFIVPAHEIITTKNGVQIYHFTSPNHPIFFVKLYFGAGSYIDPIGKTGTTSLISTLIKKGMKGYNEHEVLEELDDMASGVSFSDLSKRTLGKAWGLNEYSKKTLEMMFKMINQPTFPKAPFERIRKNRLEYLKQALDSPSAIAGAAFNSILFNGTVAGRPSDGSYKDLSEIKLEDLKKFYPRIFRTDRLKVLVVGGKDKSEVLNHVVKKIEKLHCEYCGKPEQKPVRIRNKKWDVPKGKVVLVHREGFSEAHIRYGFLGPTLKVPEIYEIEIADTILSGSFNSRLTNVMREKLNLTYSINGGFRLGEDIGSFVISTSTHNKKAGRLIVELKKLLRGFGAGNITEKEVKKAKEYLIGSFPLSLQNRFDIANVFFSNLLKGLGPDYLSKYRSRVAAVQRKDVKKALKKYMKLKEAQVVIVGDEKLLKNSLRRSAIKYVVRKPEDFL